MREILFRGKTNNNNWVEGAYYKQEEFYGDKEEAHAIITSKDTLDNDLGLWYSMVIPETVGQYTGLTDKNGTKIFEGDIVKCCQYAYEWDKENWDIEIGVVKFKNGCFEFSEIFSSDGYSELSCVYDEISYSDGTYEDCVIFEVIGNVHDNPELLKSE